MWQRPPNQPLYQRFQEVMTWIFKQLSCGHQAISLILFSISYMLTVAFCMNILWNLIRVRPPCELEPNLILPRITNTQDRSWLIVGPQAMHTELDGIQHKAASIIVKYKWLSFFSQVLQRNFQCPMLSLFLKTVAKTYVPTCHRHCGCVQCSKMPTG